MTDHGLHDNAVDGHPGFSGITPQIIQRFKIVGLLVGGSASYGIPKHPPRDWDGIILVEDYESIVALLSNVHVLQEILGVHSFCPFEDPWTKVLDGPNSFRLDAVRFCGYTASGTKKSVKVVSSDKLKGILTEPEPRAIRILSQKDVRLYATSYLGTISWRVQPVTSIAENLFILHDADIFLSPRDDAGFVYGSFGCTMDMLLTGKWAYNTPAALRLPTHAIDKYSKIPEIWIPNDWTTIFSRNDRFHQTFRSKLRRCGLGDRLVPSSAPFNMPGTMFWYRVPKFPQDVLRCRQINEWNKHQRQAAIELKPHGAYSDLLDETKWKISFEISSPFSSNSTAVQLSHTKYSNISIFRKTTAEWKAEIEGGSQLQALGSRIHAPVFVDSERATIYYPWFPGGISVADLRLRYYRLDPMSRDAKALFQILVEAEMRRSEDMLYLYCRTASLEKANSFIQKFFCARIENNNRILQLYPSGVTVGGKKHDIEHLLSLPLYVNGKQYPPLADSFREANSELSGDGITVVGLGDAHGGNVLIGEKQKNSAEMLRYIDYEAAGRHSPWIDMAKPIFNDVFFPFFYADVIGTNLIVEGMVDGTVLEDGEIKIDFPFKLDELSYSIWQIKRRYLVEPLVRHIESKGFDTTGWHRKLGLSLLCCAVLTKGFETREDLILACIAMGAMFAQWDGSETFEGRDPQVERMGNVLRN